MQGLIIDFSTTFNTPYMLNDVILFLYSTIQYFDIFSFSLTHSLIIIPIEAYCRVKLILLVAEFKEMFYGTIKISMRLNRGF